MEKFFKKKEVKEKIKKILKLVKKHNLDGKVFILSDVIGDYQYSHFHRVIKEVLFKSSETYGPKGARWHLTHPKASVGKMARRVMKFSMTTVLTPKTLNK